VWIIKAETSLGELNKNFNIQNSINYLSDESKILRSLKLL
jgi:hypothetical protein